jgi:hypothetical protein
MAKGTTTFRKTSKGNWMSGNNILSAEAVETLGLEMKSVVRKSTFVGSNGEEMVYFGVFAEIDSAGTEKLKKVPTVSEVAQTL